MSSDNFETVFTVTDPDNILMATVTAAKHMKLKRLSVSFTRQTQKEGRPVPTFWLYKRHLLALYEMLPRLIERVDAEEEKARNAAHSESFDVAWKEKEK